MLHLLFSFVTNYIEESLEYVKFTVGIPLLRRWPLNGGDSLWCV